MSATGSCLNTGKSIAHVETVKLLITLLQGTQNDVRYGAADEDITQLREGIRQTLRPLKLKNVF